MSNFAIGVDLGGTNLRIAAVNEEGRLLEKVTLGTKVALGRDHVINDMCEAIRHLSDKYQAGGRLLGVGIGVPGIIDMQTGMVRESPNLPGWSDYPVRDEIEKRLQAPVILENDANVAALGEKWLGAGRHVGDMAMLTLGTGVGGGVILNGKIWHGMTGMQISACRDSMFCNICFRRTGRFSKLNRWRRYLIICPTVTVSSLTSRIGRVRARSRICWNVFTRSMTSAASSGSVPSASLNSFSAGFDHTASSICCF